ncbi:serine/threonine-protein kinase RIO3-like [Diabrotica virgifera virgifera]|uniref:non-specific serine/threonine protein kinase n=1 Tax=Diabrotica virgifera virgifera TaxID=50390 RepID=A0ABM5JK32_DIAVI|nr:serine/threonine-protein kinase RIO3-like [Diabrotica virgifera virgifera]
MTSPWAKIEQPHLLRLEEIISEEVAKKLQEKEDKRLKQETKEGIENPVGLPVGFVNDKICDIDEQEQSRKELNTSSNVSLVNHCRTDSFDRDSVSDSDEEEILDEDERKFWDKFETLGPEFVLKPQCSYKVLQNRHMLTKGYGVMEEIKSAFKLRLFPFRFLSDPIKCFPENSTYSILYTMIETQVLNHVNGIINIGEEAILVHGNSHPSSKECAIKVYKTILSDFKGCDKFQKYDHRFKNRKQGKVSRGTISICAEKEKNNLMRAYEAGVPCPKVLALDKHILVMEFLGENQLCALTLKHAQLTDDDWVKAYGQVIESMKNLYNKANLIHADLTENNILWHQDKCYFIDLSESLESDHEEAFVCLYRDCTNITTFFSEMDVPEVATPIELVSYITGFDFGDLVAFPDLKEAYKRQVKPQTAICPEQIERTI